jgi:hypothetical protein
MGEQFIIQDQQSKTYFRGMTGIGPCFGGTMDTAQRFDGKMEAAMATRGRNWAMVLWDIVPYQPKKREAKK